MKSNFILFLTALVISINVYSQELYPYLNKGKWGFCNSQKQIVIACKYDSVLPFSEGMSVVKLHGLYGYINTKDSLFVQCKYTDAVSFVNGMANVKDKDWGYINKKGELVIPCDYKRPSDFDKNGYAFFYDAYSSTNYYIDKTGSRIDPALIKRSPVKKKLLQLTKRGDKWGVEDSLGKKVIPCKYDKCVIINETNFLVKDENSVFFINRQNVKTNTINFDNYFFYESDSLIVVINKDKKSGLINLAGKEVVPCIHKDIYTLQSSNIYCIVFDKNKRALVNQQGDFINPFQYEDVRKINNELFKVMRSSFSYYIHRNGAEFIDLISEKKYQDSISKAKLILNSRILDSLSWIDYSSYLTAGFPSATCEVLESNSKVIYNDKIDIIRKDKNLITVEFTSTQKQGEKIHKFNITVGLKIINTGEEFNKGTDFLHYGQKYLILENASIFPVQKKDELYYDVSSIQGKYFIDSKELVLSGVAHGKYNKQTVNRLQFDLKAKR